MFRDYLERYMFNDKSKEKIKRVRAVAVTIVSLAVIFVCVTVIFVVSKLHRNEEAKTTYPNASEALSDISEFIQDDLIGSEGTVAYYDNAPALEDVVRISQLQTLSYNYNSICTVSDNGNVVYYVSYEGNVVLGIDVNDITINIDDRSKIVSILLPDVSIQSYNVDPSSLSYIFVDSSYNTGSTGTQAQVLCEEDLISKIPNEGLMFNLARENTQTEIEALTKPIIEQFYSDYTLLIEFV